MRDRRQERVHEERERKAAEEKANKRAKAREEQNKAKKAKLDAMSRAIAANCLCSFFETGEADRKALRDIKNEKRRKQRVCIDL